jgi:PAS domain S-box-containing protein
MGFFSDASFSEEQLLHILSFSPVPTGIYYDADVKIAAANEAMLSLWGKPRSVIGKPMHEALPELIGQPFIGILKSLIASGEDYEAKDRAVELFVDGRLQTFYFDFVYKSVRMADGTNCILNTAKDVTDRRNSRMEIEALNNDLLVLNAELSQANEQYFLSNQALAHSQKETELQRKDLYDFIMEAPAGICLLTGRDMLFELVNAQYQQLLPNREIMGKPLFEALPELIDQPIEKILEAVFETGEPQRMAELLVPIAEREGGEEMDRYFTFNYLPRKNVMGVVTGILAFVYEVTEQVVTRKKVEESEQHFRHLADLVPAKISHAYPTGEVTFFNKQWLDFSGMGFEDLRDFGYHQMLHPDEVADFQRGLQKAAETGVSFVSEMRFRNTAGEYVWHLNIASPILDADGVIRMWVGSTTDIQQLKQEQQRKTDFLNILSHELKTPITSIKGYIQFLLMSLQEPAGPPAPLLLNSLERVEKLVKNVTSLIDEILDLGRIESGKTEINKLPVNLNDLVDFVAEDFRITNPDHTINVVHNDQCTVLADANKLGQVLTNLVSNAIKYAPGHDVVDIDVFLDRDGLAAVSVRDHGIGVDKKEHGKIFGRFYRVEGEVQNRFTGLGIGLFISWSIIENHGGTIDIESEKGKGSVFTMRLPADFNG